MDDIIKKLKIAMIYDTQGEWDKAHEIVQDVKHWLAHRIHAYLHRKEGNMSNANYWYQYIGVQIFQGDFLSERSEIMKYLDTESLPEK